MDVHLINTVKSPEFKKISRDEEVYPDVREIGGISPVKCNASYPVMEKNISYIPFNKIQSEFLNKEEFEYLIKKSSKQSPEDPYQ